MALLCALALFAAQVLPSGAMQLQGREGIIPEFPTGTYPRISAYQSDSKCEQQNERAFRLGDTISFVLTANVFSSVSRLKETSIHTGVSRARNTDSWELTYPAVDLPAAIVKTYYPDPKGVWSWSVDPCPSMPNKVVVSTHLDPINIAALTLAGNGQSGDGFTRVELDGLAVLAVQKGLRVGSNQTPIVQTPMAPFGSSIDPEETEAAFQVSFLISQTAAGGDAALAKGDPHMKNVHGQQFDIFQTGHHVLLHVPKGASADDTLLHLEAHAKRVGFACGDIYFKEVNVSGKWAPQHPQYFADEGDFAPSRKATDWMEFGKVQLKLVWGFTDQGVHYINIFAKQLGKTGYPVGGLLGEDDHTEAATPLERCRHSITLDLRHNPGARVSGAGSTAAAEP